MNIEPSECLTVDEMYEHLHTCFSQSTYAGTEARVCTQGRDSAAEGGIKEIIAITEAGS